jgi:phosphatidylinositol alpha-mannosyltransferase
VGSLARHLRERGHEVRVIAPADRATREVFSVGRTVAVPYNGSVARIAFGPRVGLRVRRALRLARADVVHVHEPMAPSAGLLAVIASQAPVVGTFHAALGGSRAYRVAAPLLRPAWNKLAVRIAVSEEARRTATRAFGDAFRIIPNGIEPERFAAAGPVPREPRVLFIGRLEPRKGAAVLVRAFARVRAAIHDASLTIVGEGPQRAALARESAGLDVRFAGRLEHDALAREIADAAVVCAPSLGGESFGIVLLEAMASGRPVVASDIPGYAAVVRDGIDGVLTPPGDEHALAGALVSLLQDRARLESMGAAGRERAARYSWKVVAAEVEQAYEDALRTSAGDR